MSSSTELRNLLKGGRIIAPGAYEAISARAIVGKGFKVVYVSGSSVSASRGRPDLGIIEKSDMVQTVGWITRAVKVPVIADGDTGYGDINNVRALVQDYERIGAAGLHIEDQAYPKRCGITDKAPIVIDADEFCKKIQAAVAARQDPDFVVIARTDCLAGHGPDEAVRRLKAYSAAGADMLFVGGKPTWEQMGEFFSRVEGTFLFNVTAPGIPFKKVHDAGCPLVIVPGLLVRETIFSYNEVLDEMNRRGEYPPDSFMSGDEFAYRAGGHEYGMPSVPLMVRVGNRSWTGKRPGPGG